MFVYLIQNEAIWHDKGKQISFFDVKGIKLKAEMKLQTCHVWRRAGNLNENVFGTERVQKEFNE